MVDRAYNFAAGPGTLPLPVLEQVREDLLSLPGIGASPLEVSHRGRWFREVIAEAEANLRALLPVPDTHHVVFCPGGATMQFSMVAMNLLRGGDVPADYIVTGSWGGKAVTEARKEGEVRVAWDGREDGYRRVPGPDEYAPSAGARYVHFTSNETIQGVEWPDDPDVASDAVLVCDGSSDFLSRTLDLARYGVLYAGAQKNAGPAGVTVAIVRDDMLGLIPGGLPTMLDYRTYVEAGSLHNTPPVFAIWVLMLVTRWLRDAVGGLDAQLEANREKARLVYDEIDASDGFYRGHAEPGSRSLMNVTFRLPDEDLDARFVTEAAAAGLIELRGHRSVGGIRASLYNAMPMEGARALARFMGAFREANAGSARALG
ncbi:MAG: 3-phosphoserine/phosphohydroxythreonine transaminase [Actinomycetota bacterium]